MTVSIIAGILIVDLQELVTVPFYCWPRRLSLCPAQQPGCPWRTAICDHRAGGRSETQRIMIKRGKGGEFCACRSDDTDVAEDTGNQSPKGAWSAPDHASYPRIRCDP